MNDEPKTDRADEPFAAQQSETSLGSAERSYKNTYGLAVAIVSAAAAIISCIVMGLMMGYIFANTFGWALASILSQDTDIPQPSSVPYVIGMFVCLAVMIAAFVLSIVALRRYKAARRNGARPAATLAVAVFALIVSGVGLIWSAIGIPTFVSQGLGL